MNVSASEPATTAARIHPFVAWNAALLREFFSPAQCSEPVVLAVGREELDDIAPDLGGFAGLIAAARMGPPWIRREVKNNLARWAQLLQFHRSRPERRPPDYVDPTTVLPYGEPAERLPTYLPLLAALVAIFGDEKEGGFYAHARDALNLAEWSQEQLRDVNALWDDLAAWTRATGGKYGTFKPGRFGHQRYVGELRAQGFFRATDSGRLPYVFLRVGVRPGEQLHGPALAALFRAIRDEHRLSVGVREAAKDPTYHDALRDRMQDVADDWDGLPPTTSSGGDDRRARPVERFARELGISLLTTNGTMPWRLGWRIQTALSDGMLRLRHEDCEWTAVLSGQSHVTAVPTHGAPGGALLESARVSAEKRLDVAVTSRSNEFDPRTLRLTHRSVRYLVFDPGEQALVERDCLPNNGGGYLLVSPGLDQLRRILHEHGVYPEEAPAEGLSPMWQLFHVSDCSRLLDVALPDGRDVRPRGRVLRLDGGVRIRRGGRILYLHYDLPRLEVDAPPGTTLHAEGLSLEEQGTKNETRLALDVTALRTFCVELDDTSRQHFVIEARRGGEVIGTATLRVATADIAASGTRGTIGLDRWGGSTTVAPMLVGTTLSVGTPHTECPTTFVTNGAGASAAETRLAYRLRSNPSARFLDSLAMSDAQHLPYGAARDRLRRYLNQEGFIESVQPILRDLRRRGYIEIVTDPRGRWTGIARVPPMIWSIPVTAAGRSLWAVGGTLSFGEWSSLFTLDSEVVIEETKAEFLPTVRLVGRPMPPVGASFTVAERPCTSIAAFSAGEVELRARLADLSFEQLDARATEVETFEPMRAEWQAGMVNEGNLPPAQWTLLRYLDPETGAHLIRSLINQTAGGPRYRHVRDERWATWIAYAARIDWVERVCGQDGIAPWPLHYDEHRGDVWLPARMNLPYVLERALVAASGEGPSELRISRTATESDGSFYAMTPFGTRVGPFARSHDHLLPEGEQRLWLRYRWIPPELAATVADRLGCRVLHIDSA